ncbi:MAG: PAS domain-containing protein [Pseudomonadota bacterium]
MDQDATGPGQLRARELFESIDWQQHPLGPREAWPVSLRTLLDLLFASSESMYLVWGSDRTFFFNDPYVPILGPRIDGAMGARFETLWADAYPSVAPYFEKALQGQSTRVVDMYVPMTRWGSPEDTWWTFSYAPVADDSGAIAGALCNTRETTATVLQGEAERQAREALGATERSLRRAQEAGQVGVFAIDIPSGQLTGSPEFFKLFGLPESETISAADIERLVIAEDRASISNAETRAAETADLHVEYRIRRADTGAVRCIDRRGEFEYGADGTPSRLVGVVQDVTDRRDAREELAKLNETLEATVVERTQALLLHENIIQSDITAICAFDTAFRLIAFNQAHNDEFFRVNGFYTKIGDVFPDLFVPEQRGVMRAQMARALTGESFTVEEEFGNPEIDAPRWEIHYSPLRDAQGKVMGAFHHARDISARLRAQNELETARDALRQSQKMEAMGQLTGGVAHDFNNLLTPILGSLELLQRRPGLTEREARLIDAGLQSADRARILVQRLLAFARRQPLQSGAVDLATLVGDMADLLASTSGPQIKVETAIAQGLPPVMADANQLEMALLNLCVNARDAMPDGGVITIAARTGPCDGDTPAASVDPAGGTVCLSVADTGIGMDAETVQRAVEPFYSTKGIGKGTGLGLSMVHGLVSQLGGVLDIDSTPGQGTTITLSLPVSATPVVASEPVEPPVERPAGGRILVVDDEPLVRMSTVDLLEALGFQAEEAGDATEAQGIIARSERFDLVITDHLMPGMSGADLAAWIRAEQPEVPILIASGYADLEGIPAAFPRLTKPFREQELAVAIASAMRG